MFNIKYCDIIYLYKISIYLSFIGVIYFLFNIFFIRTERKYTKSDARFSATIST